MTDDLPSGAPAGVDDVVEPVAASPGEPAEAALDAAWLDGLSDDNAEFAAGKGWDGADAIVSSYRNLEGLLGHDRAGRTVTLPQDEDDAAGYDALYDRLGRPDAPEGYRLEDETALPLDDAMIEWFRDTAYDSGLTERQAAGLYGAWNGMIAERLEQQNHTQQTAEKDAAEALRADWGDAYEARMAAAGKAARRFGGTDAESLAAALGHAPVAAFLARVGAAMGEDALPAGDGARNFGLSAGEARTAYDSRKQDPEFVAALQDARHPGHAAASAERARYLGAIWPGR